ncbi:hypothetical protein BV898_03550 [Hypsibius exemplaris]|uniref:Uncharacterized protein n=1 Tax=Hypsibius exemplaris TaxID=2072580 RepID=A0A1W0X4F7_HYPEX|nr:hypothetical protein BV898_03550 [Hypsibius exemplaris]
MVFFDWTFLTSGAVATSFLLLIPMSAQSTSGEWRGNSYDPQVVWSRGMRTLDLARMDVRRLQQRFFRNDQALDDYRFGYPSFNQQRNTLPIYNVINNAGEYESTRGSNKWPLDVPDQGPPSIQLVTETPALAVATADENSPPSSHESIQQQTHHPATSGSTTPDSLSFPITAAVPTSNITTNTSTALVLGADQLVGSHMNSRYSDLTVATSTGLTDWERTFLVLTGKDTIKAATADGSPQEVQTFTQFPLAKAPSLPPVLRLPPWSLASWTSTYRRGFYMPRDAAASSLLHPQGPMTAEGTRKDRTGRRHSPTFMLPPPTFSTSHPGAVGPTFLVVPLW